MNVTISIPPRFLQQILLQAEQDYPRETCGILTGPKESKRMVTAVYPCQNVQDEYHTQDPVSFPRTARSAYFIAPKELLQIERHNRENGHEIRIIYHSHVDTGAYFSEEDQRMALAEGRPAYPGVSYLVISVRQGKAREAVLFEWGDKKKSFFQDPSKRVDI